MPLRYFTFISSILSQNLTTNTLCIYVFCTSCEPEIVLTVLKIKTKTISGLQLVKKHINQKRIDCQILD